MLKCRPLFFLGSAGPWAVGLLAAQVTLSRRCRGRRFRGDRMGRLPGGLIDDTRDALIEELAQVKISRKRVWPPSRPGGGVRVLSHTALSPPVRRALELPALSPGGTVELYVLNLNLI